MKQTASFSRSSVHSLTVLCFWRRKANLPDIRRIAKGQTEEGTAPNERLRANHTLNSVSCGRPDREKNVTASAPPMTLSRSASAKRNHASKRSWSAEDILIRREREREKERARFGTFEQKESEARTVFSSSPSSSPPSKQTKNQRRSSKSRRGEEEVACCSSFFFGSALVPSAAACSPASPSRRAEEAGRQRP